MYSLSCRLEFYIHSNDFQSLKCRVSSKLDYTRVRSAQLDGDLLGWKNHGYPVQNLFIQILLDSLNKSQQLLLLEENSTSMLDSIYYLYTYYLLSNVMYSCALQKNCLRKWKWDVKIHWILSTSPRICTTLRKTWQ